MNAAQATRLATLLAEAVHPPTCPITGQPYDAEEMAGFGEATASFQGYDREHGQPAAPQMMEIRLNVPSTPRDLELYLDPTGVLWSWSTIQIPAEDCDCECAREDDGAFREDRCPVHGDGVREIDCYRRVTSIGWELTDRPTMLAAALGIGSDRIWQRWTYVAHEGDPIRDVLAEYREHRAKALAA